MPIADSHRDVVTAMLNRRRTLQTGLATLVSVAAPLPVLSQPKPHVKVRYNEIARTILFMPTYVAIAKGYFDEVGLDVTVATAQGGDKLLAIMLSNQADIALGGPSCPVALFPASSEREKVSFNQINKKTGNRIRYRKVDAESGDEVDSADILRAMRSAKASISRSSPKSLRPSLLRASAQSRSTSLCRRRKSTNCT